MAVYRDGLYDQGIIFQKLKANQLQQLQSGSPVPITENQLQKIEGGKTPFDDR